LLKAHIAYTNQTVIYCHQYHCAEAPGIFIRSALQKFRRKFLKAAEAMALGK
jgi:hypothetical protein